MENAINLIDDNAAVWEKRKEKIEKIVQLSYAQSSPFFATWDWTPHDAMVMFAPEIAAVIAHKSHSMLFAVGSKDWLLYAKGERQASVENFGRLHQALFQTLSRHLHEHPEEGDKYNNVAKVRYSDCYVGVYLSLLDPAREKPLRLLCRFMFSCVDQ